MTIKMVLGSINLVKIRSPKPRNLLDLVLHHVGKQDIRCIFVVCVREQVNINETISCSAS